MSSVKYRKVVILGHIAVGKTALTLQFVRGEFPKEYEPTLEDTYSKRFVLGTDVYDLDLVDTASHLELSTLPQSFSIAVDGYIIMYSVDSLTSFQIASVLYRKLEERRGKACLPIVLVGNKKDIAGRSRQVSTLDGLRLADSWEVPFFEISAANPEECKQVFIKILEEINLMERSFTRKKKCHVM